MIEFKQNILLADYTSWMIGGPADYFCLPTTVDELIEAVTWAKQKALPITLLGGGSNVLVSDQGVEGLVICLRKFTGTEQMMTATDLKITALAGTGKSDLLKIFLKNKLAPALFMAGLPGDVGGGVVMNAGVAEQFVPREFGELVEWVEVLDTETLKVKKFTHDQIIWKYRHTDGWQPGVITRVGITWPLKYQEGILEQVKLANRTRLTKQPLDMPSCGSVFRNPEGYKSAQLIDSCALKGFKIGDAQVSLKHANFIVNLDQATAQDTWAVIQHVKATVKKEKNVDLQTEVIRLGRWAGS